VGRGKTTCPLECIRTVKRNHGDTEKCDIIIVPWDYHTPLGSRSNILKDSGVGDNLRIQLYVPFVETNCTDGCRENGVFIKKSPSQGKTLPTCHVSAERRSNCRVTCQSTVKFPPIVVLRLCSCLASTASLGPNF